MSSFVIVLVVSVVLALAAEALCATPSVTLQRLLDGESIAIGNARFSDWELISLSTANDPAPDLSQIVITPSVDIIATSLDFTANNQLTISGANSLDLTFSYQVRSLDPARPFNSHILEFTSLAVSTGGGLVFITDELTASPAIDLASTLVIDDEVSGFVQEFDLANFSQQPSITVVTNIFASGLTAADTVQLHSFSQNFFQAGPDLLAGDYNNDGAVDAADYTRWRDNLGGARRDLAQRRRWRGDRSRSI